MLTHFNVQAIYSYILKMDHPRSLFQIFSVFSNKLMCNSILRQDSNSRPSDYESPPLTTRPGLPPNLLLYLWEGSLLTRKSKPIYRYPSGFELNNLSTLEYSSF